MTKEARENQNNVQTKVTLNLHGRDYIVSCGANETKRLEEVAAFVGEKLAEIARQNDGVSESRLFMLACLMMADELIETKKQAKVQRRRDEELYVTAVEHLRERVEIIARQVVAS